MSTATLGTGITPHVTAFGCPCDYGGRRFVCTVISPRAGGLCAAVNLNPDRFCNFGCAYCEVNRQEPPRQPFFDLEAMTRELGDVLRLLPGPIRQAALSGDGEPTLSPHFLEAVEELIVQRASRRLPGFKLVLVTNGSALDRAEVQAALRLFHPRDEIWVKLDAGTEEHFQRVNRPDCSLEKILFNILQLASQRPVIIQSLFPLLEGKPPPTAEIQAFARRLADLSAAGAEISLVQIYSATRTPSGAACSHLPLGQLSEIARQVRAHTGLRTEVY